MKPRDDTRPVGARALMAGLAIIGLGEARPRSGRQIAGLRLPPHRASTADLQAIYPWMADGGVGPIGQIVGHNLLGNSVFAYDPWDWYDAGLMTNPNGLIMGEIGSGKSSLVKTMVSRGFEHGRGAAITDPKGEYDDLASHLGFTPIYLGPGCAARLNPFDLAAGGNEDPARAQDRHLEMLQALATGVLRRELTEAERALCRIAVAKITGGYLEPVVGLDGTPGVAVRPGSKLRTPLITEVMDAMMSPDPNLVGELPISAGELRDKTADLIMGCRRLIDGDLRGMFDEPTNIDVDMAGRFLSVNIEAVLRQRPEALPLVRICSAAWLRAAIASRRLRRYVLSDEAWADLTIGTLRWHQAAWKLARSDLSANLVVFHKPGDILTAGDAGSEKDSLARSLIADAGTVVLYHQKADQVDLLRGAFGLTDAQIEWVLRLRRAQALWQVDGRRSFLVQHVRTDIETAFTNTDPTAEDLDDDDQAQNLEVSS